MDATGATRRAAHGAVGGAEPRRDVGARAGLSRRSLGTYGERMAARYLRERGCQVLDQNWRCPLGEIDLVVRDGRDLVICEVKTRRGTAYGSPVEAVDRRKLARLRRLGASWLSERRTLPEGLPWRVDGIRVDVVGVLRPRSGACVIEHLVGVGA